jgi:cytosine/adenosine deaminase-related metal-dependent hydrolase
MSRSEALKSITLYPAQFIGVEDRFGGIEKGKEANLIFLTGDPLNPQSWVDKVMLAGKIVYEKDKDRRLKKLLEKPKEEPAQKEPKPPDKDTVKETEKEKEKEKEKEGEGRG